MKQRVALVLLLAGKGTRLYEDIGVKKQFYLLNGKELFLYTLERMLDVGFFTDIVFVIDDEDKEKVKEALKKVSVPQEISLSFALGGKDRNESVYHGLEKLKETYGKEDFPVFLHDADRVLVNSNVLRELFEESRHYKALTTVLPVHDSLLKEKDGEITYVDRSSLYQIQTPQVFAFQTILSLYEKGYDSSDTDDFKKAVKAKVSYHLVRGDIATFKVTEKDDLSLLEKILVHG